MLKNHINIIRIIEENGISSVKKININNCFRFFAKFGLQISEKITTT